MRLSLLLLLALVLGAAPAAVVPTEIEIEQEDAQPDEAPVTRTVMVELNPGANPAPGPHIQKADEDDSLRFDWPPARYARNHRVIYRPPAPPREPPRDDLRAGHLTLPPPSA